MATATLLGLLTPLLEPAVAGRMLLEPAVAARTLLAADDAGGGMLGMFAPILIVFVIFYLLVFRPASRERKAKEALVKNLKKHDQVITNAGIYGTVVSLDDETVTLRVDDNVRIRFARAAVWQVTPHGASRPETPAPNAS